MLADEQLGRYRIVEKIGSGGMGDVYLAEDTKLKRSVALKTLPPDVASDNERMRRFMHEAKTASGLNHPNIITIYEINDEGETPYIAMEYVKGDTLGKVIKKQRVDLHTILDVASQVAGALAAAHDANVVHRDIKPDNIIRRPDGLVKVLDFGLAKLTENDGTSDPEAETVAHRTNPGMILGTASFMSPEQARAKSIDGRSDIFSFGIVLYQMISGRLPFRGENYVDVIGAILHKEPPSLTELVEDVPAEIDALVRKCLRKNREERFQSARELLADLNELKQVLNLELRSGQRETRTSDPAIKLSTDDAMAVGISTHSNTRLATSSISRMIAEEIKLHPLRAVGIMVLVALGLGASSFGLSKVFSTNEKTISDLKFTRLTNTGNVDYNSAALAPEGKMVAYVTDADGKQTLWVRQASGERSIEVVPAAEVKYRGVAFSPDAGKLYYAAQDKKSSTTLFRVDTFGGEPKRIATDADGTIAVSPDGERVAFLRGPLHVMLVSAGGGEVKQIASMTDGKRISAMAWAPDGRSITVSAFSSADTRHHIISIDTQTGELKPFPGPTWLRVTGIAWRMDGTGVYISGRDNDSQYAQIWFIQYPSGTVSQVTNDTNVYANVSVSKDGRSILSFQETRSTSIWEIGEDGSGERRVRKSIGTEDGVGGVVKAADGRIVYTVRKGAMPQIWTKSPNGPDERELTAAGLLSFAPDLSPDGRYVAFVSNSGGEPNIWRMDTNGENQTLLAATEGLHTRVKFTPDGNWVVYETISDGEECSLWRVPTAGGEPERLLNGIETCRPALSPDGNWVVYYSGTGNTNDSLRLMLSPIDGSQPPRQIDAADILKRRLYDWSADGTSIIYANRVNDVDNFWRQPIDGGTPVRLTNFDSDWIYWFGVSRTSGNIVASRGSESTDAVLIEGNF